MVIVINMCIVTDRQTDRLICLLSQTDRQIRCYHIQVYADFFFQLNVLPPYFSFFEKIQSWMNGWIDINAIYG